MICITMLLLRLKGSNIFSVKVLSLVSQECCGPITIYKMQPKAGACAYLLDMVKSQRYSNYYETDLQIPSEIE